MKIVKFVLKTWKKITRKYNIQLVTSGINFYQLSRKSQHKAFAI